ncbi:tripartite tricarboxylate transporter TctB family protein [Aliamphritea spongicola]|uniref:tripartite tricarboxylate transporter TctB family protein n=1 Tax=Aliamphritea spongicola TaxID=707589 RepID=UPI00196B48F3|nr:tripartite tricarboxylate transporter TctB family protein [Aliamphritea spongicola]MBN3561043.1 tripartite tricarboxylate transporter TctB family protein [Aliamphritea spongicola]
MHHHTDGDLTSFNIIAASALLLTGLISWFYLIPRYVATDPEQAFGLSPAFMPQVAAGCVCLLASLLLIKSLRIRFTRMPAMDEESEDGDDLQFAGQECLYLGVFAVYATSFMLMFQSLGFAITSTCALAGIMWVFRIRPHWLIILLAVSVPLLLQTALWYGLTIDMPGISLGE